MKIPHWSEFALFGVLVIMTTALVVCAREVDGWFPYVAAVGVAALFYTFYDQAMQAMIDTIERYINDNPKDY